MPKGRMLNKKISIDEELNELSINAAFLFTWCIPHLDIKGRIIGTPDNIKGTVVPFKKEITTKKISILLREIAEKKRKDGTALITIYGNGKYIQFHGFEKNQTLYPEKEAESIIPDITPEQLQSNSRATPEEVKLSKVKLSKDIYIHYGEYVKLKKEEYLKLIDKLGKDETDRLIERMNNGIAAKGYKYKSHYRALLNWSENDFNKHKKPIKDNKHYERIYEERERRNP